MCGCVYGYHFKASAQMNPCIQISHHTQGFNIAVTISTVNDPLVQTNWSQLITVTAAIGETVCWLRSGDQLVKQRPSQYKWRAGWQFVILCLKTIWWLNGFIRVRYVFRQGQPSLFIMDSFHNNLTDKAKKEIKKAGATEAIIPCGCGQASQPLQVF